MLGFISIIGAIPIWYLVEMDGFSKSSSVSSSPSSSDNEFDDEDRLASISEDPLAEILSGDEYLPYDSNDELLDTVSGPSLNRRKSLEIRKSSEAGEGGRRRSLSNLERRMSSPIGIRGGSVGPGGGRRLSNGLAASNFGQGTGGTSFA